ncbi:CPBP family intramembrane metalloprotease [Clostridium botulinum]|nr:CPBP family intramembrane glutamic endopeptidase [Clostridium botulinum]
MISIKKINDKMYNLSKPKFIIIILVLYLIISITFIPIQILYEKYVGPIGGPTGYSNLKLVFIDHMIISPLFETLLFQMGIIKLFSLSEKIKNNKLLLVIISAFPFGLVHGIYSTLYIFCAFSLGILLAYSFIVYEDKEGHGFWVTAIIHSLMNLIAFVF